MRLVPLLLAALFIGCDGPDKDTGDTDPDTDTPSSDADGDGYTASTGDCDDDDAAVYPGADEVWYDGVDQDCDEKDDFDQDEDGHPQDVDCDDEDAAVSPDAADVCDGFDNDCDGEVDEGGEFVAYLDADGDGFGTGEPLGQYCELPAGTASNPEDCNDTDAAISPMAPEICDAVDNDCDGEVDIGASDGRVVYTDADGDGYGDPATGMGVCGDAPGTVEDATDCDDTDAATFPGAAETCDLEDNNCDGAIDEGSPEARVYYADADGDGYGDAGVTAESCGAPAGYVEEGTDCDDADATRSPGATEVCDGLDNDCDAEIDADAADAATLYFDGDSDGYGDPGTLLASCEPTVDGYVADGTDCDDADARTNPDALELCDDTDNDCNGTTDESTAVDAASWYIDADLDGYGDSSATATSCDQPTGFVASDTDCNDTVATVHPGAAEVCDEVDQDCDGTVDDDAGDAGTWYADEDGDGYGDPAASEAACDAPGGYVADDSDCNDRDADVSPSATEVCDDLDQDCDGRVDDGATDATSWYADDDGDGYGDPSAATVACDAPANTVADATDCDDAASSAYPGAIEACDDRDNDCDGSTDEAGAAGEATWYLDGDGDGYGVDATTAEACDMPSGYAADPDDCDDAESATNPGASEADDGLDNDCDAYVDEDFVSPGDVVITEIARQVRVGGASTNTNAAWFELYNTTGSDIDLSNWYIQRRSSALAADGFYVDPADNVVIGADDYVVFCKTDNFTSASTSYSTLAPCDYYWGDETASASYAGTYADNTFNMQRDEDELSVYIGGSASTGTLMDAVAWTYDATDGYWPRDASRSMQLDPNAYDATDNDSIDNWCSVTNNVYFQWYYVSSAIREFGTPGGDNHTCP